MLYILNTYSIYMSICYLFQEYSTWQINSSPATNLSPLFQKQNIAYPINCHPHKSNNININEKNSFSQQSLSNKGQKSMLPP